MTWEIINWTGLYREGWKNLILPESYSHPAKYSRGLIKQIYKFLIENGLLAKGQQVIDPFAGVGLGALDAMRYGLHWVGVELEEKFIELAQESYPCPGFDIDFWRRYQGRIEFIGLLRETRALCPSCETALTPKTKFDKRTGRIKERRIPERSAHIYRGNLPLWQHKYGNKLPNYGTAYIVQGDSRRLREVLAAADCVTTSPPFSSTLTNDSKSFTPYTGLGHYQYSLETTEKRKGDYGSTPGNLGNLPARDGDLDTALKADIITTSPPYADEQLNDSQRRAQNLNFKLEQPHTYNAAISSPPFATGDSAGPESLHRRTDETAQKMLKAQGWHGGGQVSKGNLAAMPEGSVDLINTSPPFLQTSGGTNVTSKSGALSDASLIARHAAGNAAAQSYGESESNLGNMAEGSIDLINTSPPYSGLDTSGTHITGTGKTDPNNKDYRPWAEKLLKGEKGNSYTTQKGYESGDGYGFSPAQLGNLREGSVDAELTSPPFEKSNLTTDKKFMAQVERDKRNGSRLQPGLGTYGETEGNIGNSAGDTFWAASKQILSETFALLRAYVPGKPGGIACFVTKDYIRAGARVPFSDNWRRLAESVGFLTFYEIRAWLTEDNGTQLALDGNHKRNYKKRSSFFRKLAETNAKAKAYWKTLSLQEQNIYMIQATVKFIGLRKPTLSKWLGAAQKLAYLEANKPEIETETEISFETVWVMVKP